MSKNPTFKFTLLASAMLAAMTLASCSVDDNPINGQSTEADIDYDPTDGLPVDYEYVAPDGLAYFMSHIIGRDSLGNFTHFIYGVSLDEADPTVLSIGVESLEQADSIFRSFIAAKESDILTVSTGIVTYYPTDSLGRHQGEIRLTPADDCIAKITFSEEIENELVSEIRFIRNALWPNNEQRYFLEKYKTYYFDEEKNPAAFTQENAGNNDRTWLCVQGDKNGTPAILIKIWRAKYSYYYDYHKYYWGAWFTETKGNGTLVKMSSHDEREDMWSGDSEVTPSWKALVTTIDIIHNDGFEKFKKVYGDVRLKQGDIIWSRQVGKSTSTFQLYARRVGVLQSGSFRAYTNLGHWSKIITTSDYYGGGKWYYQEME
ncbi:MAG: hypothetical protein IJ580_03130 [Prevotella sp.]|nr:hypothetical protein [Prevotella sp.]